MGRWEYRIVNMYEECGLGDEEPRTWRLLVQQRLNELGEEGWELVSVPTEDYEYHFKRFAPASTSEMRKAG